MLKKYKPSKWLSYLYFIFPLFLVTKINVGKESDIWFLLSYGKKIITSGFPKYDFFKRNVGEFTKKLGFNDWYDTKAYLSYDYRIYNNTVKIYLKDGLSDLDKIAFAMRGGMSLHSALNLIKGVTR